MDKERILVIIYGKFLLQFALLEASGGEIKSLASQRIRLFDRGYNFSIADYILQSLTLWGKEVDISLVKEMVPLVPRSGKEGVDDIFIFTHKAEESFYTITNNVFLLEKDVTREGVLNIVKFLKFYNLLVVSFDCTGTSITRFRKYKKGRMKVVSESEDFNIQKLVNNSIYRETLGFFKSTIKPSYAINSLLNGISFPLFNLRSLEGCLLEYLSANSRLEIFKKCKKLDLDSFGGGSEKNILVISGERIRFVNNVPIFLLSILSTFSLRGNFSVYIDKLGFFDFLQKQKKQVLSDRLYSNSLVNFWGKVVVINAKKRMKLDEVAADVDVKDGDSKRQIIPMYGRISKFTYLEKGSLKLETRKGFDLEGKKTELGIKDTGDNIVIDTRARPVEKNFEMKGQNDLVVSWLKGIGATN